MAHRAELVTATFFGYGHGWYCRDCPAGSGWGMVYDLERDALAAAQAHELETADEL